MPFVDRPVTPNAIDVWYWSTQALDGMAIDSLRGVLSPAERSRADRFVFDRDRRDYIAAHALVRHILSRAGPRVAHEWQFVDDVYGKPTLVAAQAGDPRIVFNLSHAQGLVACGVARATRIGIDVERVQSRVDAPAIARAHFAPAEVAMLESVPVDERDARFAELWVLKEAYIKGLGVGLGAHPLDSFAFSVDDTGGLRCEEGGETVVGPWQFALVAPSTEYRLAVAVELPLVNGRWTLNINAIGSRADPELLASSGPLSFGFSRTPGNPTWCPPIADPND
jgi:4'-phosphopantetheinyl transferase